MVGPVPEVMTIKAFRYCITVIESYEMLNPSPPNGLTVRWRLRLILL